MTPDPGQIPEELCESCGQPAVLTGVDLDEAATFRVCRVCANLAVPAVA